MNGSHSYTLEDVSSEAAAANQTRYFDDIAQDYEQIRGSEIWPSLLHSLSSIAPNTGTVLDVATGTGLFSVRLAQEGFQLIGLDQNPCMLAQATRKAKEQGCPFNAVVGSAEELPLPEKSISVIYSTNAIHLFDLQSHFREVSRVLKPGGFYIVYTRFKKHNDRSIWGRLFPRFSEKETRLYNPEDFERLDRQLPDLVMQSLGELSFEIPFSYDRLLQDAHRRKYSTFAFYDETEFRRAFSTFRSRLQEWKENFYRVEIGRMVFRHE